LSPELQRQIVVVERHIEHLRDQLRMFEGIFSEDLDRTDMHGFVESEIDDFQRNISALEKVVAALLDHEKKEAGDGF
jgi:hypothetical protein